MDGDDPRSEYRVAASLAGYHAAGVRPPGWSRCAPLPGRHHLDPTEDK